MKHGIAGPSIIQVFTAIHKLDSGTDSSAGELLRGVTYDTFSLKINKLKGDLKAALSLWRVY